MTITFKAKVGDRDFVCGQEYPDQGSSKLTATPRDFRFFVQDVQLVSADGEPVPLTLDERSPAQSKDVALIDFTPATGACFGSGTSENTTLTGTVPAGDTSYTGIRFVNAVPEALNHENLPKAKAPLQNALTHWGWQSGYRFIMAEIVSTSVDEDAGIPESTLVHIGSTACSGTVANGFTCSRPNRNQIELSGFDPTEHAIVADFEKVFERVDLGAGQQCHGPDPACKSMYDAFGVNLDTGAASDTQSVFRKE